MHKRMRPLILLISVFNLPLHNRTLWIKHKYLSFIKHKRHFTHKYHYCSSHRRNTHSANFCFLFDCKLITNKPRYLQSPSYSITNIPYFHSFLQTWFVLAYWCQTKCQTLLIWVTLSYLLVISYASRQRKEGRKEGRKEERNRTCGKDTTRLSREINTAWY
jgi:hypothetical protein